MSDKLISKEKLANLEKNIQTHAENIFQNRKLGNMNPENNNGQDAPAGGPSVMENMIATNELSAKGKVNLSRIENGEEPRVNTDYV